MPALALELKPRGRSASVRRAKDRYRDRSGVEERVRQEQAAQERAEERDMRARMQADQQPQEIDLQQEHREALARQEPWSKKVDLAGDFARAAGEGRGEDEGGDDGAIEPVRISRAERPAERARARRRRRDDDFERER